jgi:hypothetical protein
MNARLTRPPQQNSSKAEWQQWAELLWRVVLPAASVSGDANATIPSTSTYHGVTALTAGRNVTLPSTGDVPDGAPLVVQDESNAAGAHTITLLAAAGDTIKGTSTISSNYGRRALYKRAKVWYSA